VEDGGEIGSQAGLIGFEGERWNGCLEEVSGIGDAEVHAMHAAKRAANSGAAVVGEGLPGLKKGLLTKNPKATDLLPIACGVFNDPVTSNQLGRNGPDIAYGDNIGKAVGTKVRVGLFGKILALNFDFKMHARTVPVEKP
jgi:hypothetical protein